MNAPQLMAIPEAREFILHWGEMGSRWGISRSVAQIYALLYLSDRPLTAEEISAELGLARSNVSTAMKELQGLTIVRRQHIPGDRRDHFAAEYDPWELFMRIVAERKRREIDPTVATLGELSAKVAGNGDVPPHIRDRIRSMHGFATELDEWYEDVRALPQSTLGKLVKLGGKVSRFLNGEKAGKSGKSGKKKGERRDTPLPTIPR